MTRLVSQHRMLKIATTETVERRLTGSADQTRRKIVCQRLTDKTHVAVFFSLSFATYGRLWVAKNIFLKINILKFWWELLLCCGTV